MKNLNIPLILPASLESRRNEFEKTIILAKERIHKFAENYNWQNLMKKSFIDEVRIFDNKQSFDAVLLEMNNMDLSTKLPKTYSACLENRILMAVSPEIFLQNYPEGEEDSFFEKLLAHEIAHRLHIRILNGDEEAMGPVWFYEGFAVYAAGQFQDPDLQLALKDVLQIINDPKRGSYRKYGFVLRYLLQKISLPEMVQKAEDGNFNKWISELVKELF